MSFWNKFQRRGPKDEPCGQPSTTLFQSLVTSFNIYFGIIFNKMGNKKIVDHGFIFGLKLLLIMKIKKIINIAIRATYYIFCCRNRNWDSPDLMQV